MSGYDFENFTFKFIEDVENNILEYQTELSAVAGRVIPASYLLCRGVSCTIT